MDKTFLKIAGIIATIIGVFYCITIIGLIIGIPLVIGGLKFMSYADSDDNYIYSERNSILGWSIFFLIFGFIISGVLGLLFYFSIIGIVINKSDNKKSYIDEIKELNELRKQGIISDKEFEERKKQILKNN